MVDFGQKMGISKILLRSMLRETRFLRFFGFFGPPEARNRPKNGVLDIQMNKGASGAKVKQLKWMW